MPEVWSLAAGIGLLCVPQMAVLTLSAIFLHDVAHLGLVQTTAAMVLYQLGAATLRVWSGHWTDRRGNRIPFLRACGVIAAVAFAAMAALSFAALREPSWLGAMAPLLFTLLAAAGMVASCWHGVAFTELATRAGPERVGTALGLGNTFVFGSYFLTPLLLPMTLGKGGWPSAWGAVALCALAAQPLLASAGRRAP